MFIKVRRVTTALIVTVCLTGKLCAQDPAPSAPGLGGLVHPLQLQAVNLRETAQEIPQEKRDRVHVFLINGLNPGYSANLNGLAAYYRSIGFVNTSCHQMPASWKVKRQIENIRRSDPDARIVLLGYSLGANIVRSVANGLQRDGIAIDCLVYVGGDTVYNSPDSRPGNAKRIVNITGRGFLLTGGDLTFRGDDIDGAVNHRINAPHLSLPAHRDTIDMVGKELISLAKGTTPTPATPEGQATATAPMNVMPAVAPGNEEP